MIRLLSIIVSAVRSAWMMVRKRARRERSLELRSETEEVVERNAVSQPAEKEQPKPIVDEPGFTVSQEQAVVDAICALPNSVESVMSVPTSEAIGRESDLGYQEQEEGSEVDSALATMSSPIYMPALEVDGNIGEENPSVPSVVMQSAPGPTDHDVLESIASEVRSREISEEALTPDTGLGTDFTPAEPPEAEPTPTAHIQSLDDAKPRKAPIYRPPVPVSPTARSRSSASRNALNPYNRETTLRLRVQLTFDRDAGVRGLALLPQRLDRLPDEIEVVGIDGDLHLSESLDEYYTPIPLENASEALSTGVELRGCIEVRQIRWVLGGRELYVFARGEEFRLSGFVSTDSLSLNGQHVVLAKTDLKDKVLAALNEAGCDRIETCDETTAGLPRGWILFRNVIPTRFVLKRDEADIMNALCPLSDLEPHFLGGIRLDARNWLAGFPPRIHFTGELNDDTRVMIDGHSVKFTQDGSIGAPGWDAEGEHRLWYGGRSLYYSLEVMEEDWDPWSAYDFDTGPVICGARIVGARGNGDWQVRVPKGTPLLLGACPGEIFYCKRREGLQSEFITVFAPFRPVWALPLNPALAKRCTSRIWMFDWLEPIDCDASRTSNRAQRGAAERWVSVIGDAGRKQLALEPQTDATQLLWHRYRRFAKQLRRRMK